MKWQAIISEVGVEVQDLLESSHQFDLVIEGRRDDMRDFTIHFAGELPTEDLTVGDAVTIDGTELFILAIGEQFKEHFRKHGACTVELSGGFVPETPYNVILEGDFERTDFLRDGAMITVR